MFGHLPSRDPGEQAVEALAGHMKELAHTGSLGVDDPQPLPAGYTYLGQFIDHDITFDPTSQLQRDNDPGALVNFRTPRFDLDSLYGSGPADQPFLYDWTRGSHPGVKLLVGGVQPGMRRRTPPIAAVDLPRNSQERALIGDARNDENLIVSQLHLLFIRFHNKVIDHLAGSERWPVGFEILEEAQRLVRWHYQWIVVHDFLEKIVSRDVLRDVLRPGEKGAAPTVHRRVFTWGDEPLIPVEFSGAGFRFAHSMVRPRYRLSGDPEMREVSIFPERGTTAPRWKHLGGFRARPEKLTIGWPHFFKIDETNAQRAMRINERLSQPLFSLPPDKASLARLNLHRGRALGLPAGPDVAQAIGCAALDEEELALAVDEPARTKLLRATPLWFYLLREASAKGGGKRLGPVGSRIVTEVLVGLLEADPSSYLRQAPAWTPCLPRENKDDIEDFTMADLVRFTEGTPPPKHATPRKRKEG